MSFTNFLAVLRARKRIALLVFLTTVVLAVGISLVLPKKYTAVASVVVDVKPDPITGAIYGSAMAPSVLATQVDILTSDRVAGRVIKNLKLDQIPEYRDQWREETDGNGTFEVWLTEALQKKLDVKPSRESNVIFASFQATDPRAAAGFANAFVQAYLETTIELRVAPARQYSGFFDARTKAARDVLELAQRKLSDFQQKNAIVTGDDRMDVEQARLNELMGQLVTLQAASADSNSRKTQANSGNGDRLADAMMNPVLGGLKVDLAHMQAKLEELKSRYGDNHPQVKEAKANITELQARLESETRRVSSSVAVSNSVNQQREAEVRAQVEAQKQKLLALKVRRDEMNVLQRDVDNAQRAYESVSMRRDQSNLESENQQASVSVLTPAQPPARHSSPKIFLNGLISVFLGAFLALGTALLCELADRRLRGSKDLVESLGVPVLGVMPAPLRRRAPALASAAQRVISGRLARPQT